jgi:hypothetical protein
MSEDIWQHHKEKVVEEFTLRSAVMYKMPKRERQALNEFLRSVLKMYANAELTAKDLRAIYEGQFPSLTKGTEGVDPAIRLYSRNYDNRGHSFCIEIMWDGAGFLFRLDGDKPDPSPFLASISGLLIRGKPPP